MTVVDAAGPPGRGARTLADLLGAAAAGPAGLTGPDGARTSYAALRRRALDLLGGLARAWPRGAPVPIVVVDPAALFAPLWACVLGDRLPVALPGPGAGARRRERAERLLGAWRLLGRPRLVACATSAPWLAELARDEPALAWTTLDELAAGPPGEPTPASAPDAPALLQLSSGSTAAPRAVVLTHGNVLANMRQLVAALALGPADASLCWVPHFHDMGLFLGHLAPLAAGAAQAWLTPFALLRDPVGWLRRAQRDDATLISATPFALSHLLSRLEGAALDDLDLSRVRTWLVGAEPVDPRALRALEGRLAGAGLRPGALRAAYGLAEATLLVTCQTPDDAGAVRVAREPLVREGRVAPGDDLELALCGRPVDGLELRVDAPPGRVGPVLVRGDNVARRRWGEAAPLVDAAGWLDTGDLGVVAHDGQLALTGRTRDVIRAQGAAWDPALVEREAEAAVREVEGAPAQGRVMACGVPDPGGGPDRVALAVVRASSGALRAARARVLERLGLRVDLLVPLEQQADLPRTSSGKPRRHALAARIAAGDLDAAIARAREGAAPAPRPAVTSSDALEALVRAAFARALDVDPADVDPARSLADAGGTSLHAAELLARLERDTGRPFEGELDPERLTVRGVVAALRPSPRPVTRAERPTGREPLAIVSVACRFPGAGDPDALWDLLARGEAAIGAPPAWRRDALGDAPGGWLDDVDAFEPEAFGIGEDEARCMDPQQRLLLELAEEALRAAGYDRAARRGLRVGVFVGAGQFGYQELLFRALDRGADLPPSAVAATLPNMLAARVAHHLDLVGPALMVDTACSASLVAVHLARESLLRGECDLALAGGVNLNLGGRPDLLFARAGARSPSGRLAPFTTRADGLVLGEGAGLVLLEPLSRARREGDPVLALVRGSAMNNDGRAVGGVLTPSPGGQAEVLRAAYADAGVDPGTVGLVEAHGTATPLGDLVEARALAQVLRASPHTSCWLGSIKANLGHLLGAAGVAGLIKAALALERRAVPPQLHADAPDARLDLAGAGLVLPRAVTPWVTDGPRRAGVSAFGFGGTNCHLVLEEAPPDHRARRARLDPPRWRRRRLWLEETTPRVELKVELWTPVATSRAGGSHAPLVPGGRWLVLAPPQARAALVRVLVAAEQQALAPDLDDPTRAVDEALAGGALAGVVHATTLESDDVDPEREALALADVVRALARADAARGQLLVVTRGASPLQNAPRPGGAALLALAQALPEEHPDLIARGLDLPRSASLDDVATRALEALALPARDRVLVVRPDGERVAQDLAAAVGVTSRATPRGGAWVVTGGATGVGAAHAVHLARAGANTIVVVGRTPLDAPGGQERAATLRALEQAGARAIYVVGDAGDERVLARALDAARAAGPLRGVVHAAGAIVPASLVSKDRAATSAVLAPKVRGARALARLARDDEQVVLVSSIAAVFPALGGGFTDYAAANAYLDALATRERADGRPWTSIAYSLWGETGQGAEARLAPLLEQRGLLPLPTRDALAAFDRALALEAPRVVVLAGDDSRFGSLLAPDVRQPHAPTALETAPGMSGVPVSLSFGRSRARSLTIQTPPAARREVLAVAPARSPEADRAAVRSLPSGEASGAAAGRASTPGRAGAGVPFDDVARSVVELLARATDLPPDAVRLDAPFTDLGLESMAAVDLVTALAQRLDVALRPTLFFEHRTPGQVVDAIRELRARRGTGTSTHEHAGSAGDVDAVAVVARGDVHDPRATEAPVLTASVPTAPVPTADDDARATDDAFPALPAQETFYAHRVLSPGTPSAVFVALTIDGPLDPSLMVAALERLCARHPMLRATFTRRDGRLVQRGGAGAPPPLDVVDLSGLADEARREVVQAHDDALVHRVFDPHAGPVAALLLLRLGASRWRLSANLDHLVGDAWSLAVALADLLALHEALRCGHDAPPPPAATFRACVEAITRAADPTREAASLAFWERALVAAPPPRLPGGPDLARPPRGPFARRERRFAVDDATGVHASARALGVTTAELLLACLLRALAATTGERDQVVRVALARRRVRVRGVAGVVGAFADAVPVRVHVDPAAPLGAFVTRVRRALADARAHARTSSIALASLARPSDAASPLAIGPVAFSFPRLQHAERVGALGIDDVLGAAAAAFTRVALIGWEHGGALGFTWNHPVDVVPPETVDALDAAFSAEVRAACVAGVAPRPDDDRMPTPASSTRAPSPSLHPGPRLEARVFARAAEVPDRVAVVTPERSWTYGELARRAHALSHHLRAAGARTGDLVGVLFAPGVDAVVALLGVLGAGAGYVPLDPDHPDARLRDVATRARLRLVVCPPEAAARASSLGLAPVAARAETLDEADDGPRHEGGPDAPAYVMFTSGSTGRPKGVAVSHRAVGRFHDWVHAALEVRPDDRFVQTSSLAFGGSIRQVFSPLLAGATLLPAPRGLTRDPGALLDWLEAQKITIWNSVPSLGARLLDALDARDASGRDPCELRALRWVLFGGEVVHPPLVRRWRRRFGLRHRLANLYGSTETVVNATWHEVTLGPGDDELHLPIGRPRDGSLVAIRSLPDDQNTGATEPDVGELLVGGPSLALGYLHEPELTAAAFVDDPALGRAYRTGDLVRRLPSGELVYLGRRDSQVQVHGNRVELGEVEAALERLDGVAHAAVVAHEDPVPDPGGRPSGRPGGLTLTAFVQLAPRAAPGAALAWTASAEAVTAHVRRELARSLPAYMLPHRAELLEALPRTAVGKVDRLALIERARSSRAAPDAPQPAPITGPTSARPVLSAATIAAEGAHAATLARVLDAWRAVLGAVRVGPDDDFFALGGDSMRALDLFERLRDVTPPGFPPVTIYTHRTPRTLAAAIDGWRHVASEDQGHAARPGPGDAPVGAFALTVAQRGFLLALRLRPEGAANAALGVPIEGPLDVARLRRALASLIGRHDMLRAVIVDGDRQEVRPAPSGPDLERGVPLHVVDVSAAPLAARDVAVEHAWQVAVTRRFDPTGWPQAQADLLLLGPARAWLCVSASHLIVDAWSVHVLLSELWETYARGEPARPAPRAGYRDLVEHLERARSGPRPEALAAWRSLLANAPGRLPLVGRLGPPPDRPEPATSTASRPLAAELVTRLRAAASAEATTPFVLLATCLLRLLRRATGHDDLVLSTALSGRDAPLPDVDRIVGCFARGLLLRVRLADASSATRDDAREGVSALRADLIAVASAFEAARAHTDVPMDRALAAAGVPLATADGLPGAQVFFTVFDPANLPAIEPPAGVRLRWEEARVHADVAASGHDLFVAVVLGPAPRLTVHVDGRLLDARGVDDLATRLVTDVDDAARRLSERRRQVEVDRHEVPTASGARSAEVDDAARSLSERRRQVEVDRHEVPTASGARSAEIDDAARSLLERRRQVEVDRHEVPTASRARSAEVDDAARSLLERRRQVEVDRHEVPTASGARSAEVDDAARSLSERRRQVEVDRHEVPTASRARSAEVDDAARPSEPRDPVAAGRRERSAAAGARSSPAPRTIDAAIVGYLPARSTLARLVDDPAALRERLLPDGPRLVEVLETPLGRSGLVLLPRFADELEPGPDLTAVAARACRLALDAGAASVSLAGLLPARTAYGRQVAAALGDDGARLTSGHAATVAAVVANLERAAALAALPADAPLAVVGLGSIGTASLRLLLEAGRRPSRLVLCDLPSATARLEALGAELVASGRCHAFEVSPSLEGRAPAAVYACPLILAATDRPGALDVASLAPGTLVLDDSFPPCVDPLAAAERMIHRGDVLVLEAGGVDAGPCASALRLAPDEHDAVRALVARFARSPLAGCRLESLLRVACPELPQVLGPVDAATASLFATAARRLGVRGGTPRVGEHEPSPAVWATVRDLRRTSRAGHTAP